MLLSALFGIFFYWAGGVSALLLMFLFLFASVFVTHFGHYEKESLGIYEYERGWKNVLSNGIIPLLALLVPSPHKELLFIAAVASITADKFSSELGVFDERPIYLLTLKPVKPGISGAVSSLGFIASLAGAGIIAVVAYFLYHIPYKVMLLVALSGFIGSVVDSIAGAFEEKGVGTKETSNMLGALGGVAFMGIMLHYV